VLAQISGDRLLYFSGEESEEQLALRASRMNINDSRILVACENNLENIIHHIGQHKPTVVVIDSIQTVYSDAYDNVPGSVTQVRECAGVLLKKAKGEQFVTLLVGHITKDGMIAGPKVLEHLVDTVLYLEGGKTNFYRTLRSMKNRFGSTHEVGLFTMKDNGLIPVENPSEFFLSERRKHVAGSAVAVSMEGTRPFLIEVQALVTQTSYGNPQRTANGIDHRRLAMLIAVLEKRSGLALRLQDIFVNIVGGLRIEETAVNLGVLVAIASSFKDAPLAPSAVFIGEVGLVGEIRSVPQIEQRVTEALKFGFKPIYIPRSNLKQLKKIAGTEVVGVDSINQLFEIIF
jgi:DNA repair protein RadA/Sms